MRRWSPLDRRYVFAYDSAIEDARSTAGLKHGIYWRGQNVRRLDLLRCASICKPVHLCGVAIRRAIDPSRDMQLRLWRRSTEKLHSILVLLERRDLLRGDSICCSSA